MAGIKFLEKSNFITIDYIIDRLLDPSLRKLLFDDIVGIQELRALFYTISTIVYGIYHEGKPEPIGTVFFCNVIPYRDAVLYAIIFDKENRGKGKITENIDKIKTNMKDRFKIHSCTSYVIDKNETSEHMLKKMGFVKVGEKKEGVHAGGKYRNLSIYYLCPVD